MRIGFGYDSHRFGEDVARPLVLGGVTFAGERGLVAHSDGDAVVHAVIDALLGAAALGDVGSHFPNDDERWRGAAGADLLKAVVDEVTAAGWRLENLDVTVICERPKILPRADEMRGNLARMLGCETSQVSVKGKTNERLDDIGAGRGVAVHAVCLLV